MQEKGDLMSDIDVVRKTTTKPKIDRPKMYVPVILNDDYTTFDAVIYIASTYFNKSVQEAEDIANTVHTKGKAVAGGPYTYEVCETKCYEAMQFATANEMPLVVSPEPA